MTKKLIVFEGIDCSGKSMYAEMLKNEFIKKFGENSWIHEHEPTFSSSEADTLNFEATDTWKREYYFMKDRMKHQEILRNNNVVLDRYILTGLAYAQAFSPEAIPMMTSVYSIPREFIRPDAIFFIDMDPMNALAINESRKDSPEYSPKLKIETLQLIRSSFIFHFQTIREWEVPLFIIQPFFGEIDKTFKLILNTFEIYPIL